MRRTFRAATHSLRRRIQHARQALLSATSSRPKVFYRQFSALNKPVLKVGPGDTIHTTTVDAGGADEKGVTRVLGGNPQTGPLLHRVRHAGRYAGGPSRKAQAEP